ncbi:MAG TPA: hypothetical protein PK856_04435 [Vitreoscilla sp.]|nr:hypothetical protein [Vitreoscilla sp.]
MNTTLKRGLQILGTIAILGTSACVVDPYSSGVGYGSYDGYDYDNSYTSTTRVIGNGSNFAFNTGFLVGNYYYYDDNYYPVNYYTSGGTRYYRPVFDRPYHIHPDSRYRNLNRNQLEQWRRNQSIRYDPSYRPNHWNNGNRDHWNNRDKNRWDNNRGNNRWNNGRDDKRWDNRRPIISQPSNPNNRPNQHWNRPQVQPPRDNNMTRPSVRPTPSIPTTRPNTQVTRPTVVQPRPQVQPIRSVPNNRPIMQNRSSVQSNDTRSLMQNSRSQMQMQPRLDNSNMGNRRMHER